MSCGFCSGRQSLKSDTMTVSYDGEGNLCIEYKCADPYFDEAAQLSIEYCPLCGDHVGLDGVDVSKAVPQSPFDGMYGNIYEGERYPWRYKHCPYQSPYVCPCIRDAESCVRCDMQVSDYAEQQRVLKLLEAEHLEDDCDEASA